MESPSPSPAHSRSSTATILQTSSSHANCQHKEDARNLVACIDGMSNQFGRNNTNVVKLFAGLKLDSDIPHRKQYAYYSSGQCTDPKSLPMFSRWQKTVTDKVEIAIPWNMEEILKDVYGWLAQRYEDGDRIFLFGFSRGAYQVRVLAAMIHEVGLIKTVTQQNIDRAYDHYNDMHSGQARARQTARDFRRTFSWKDLSVHFVGVWDTVSSIGLLKANAFFSTSPSITYACHLRHALALDERRVHFMPEYFQGMNSLVNVGTPKYLKYAVSDQRKSSLRNNEATTATSSGEWSNTTPDIKEVWFAGCHSDLGGKNKPGNSHQAGNVSLVWMRREAAEHGLALQPTDMVWVPGDLDFGISDPMSSGWQAVEYLPISHQIFFGGRGEHKRRPHLAQPRRILPGQRLHASILCSNTYRPEAMVGIGFDMPIIHPGLEDVELDGSIWEAGLFDSTAAEGLLKRLDNGQGIALLYLDRLLFMLRFKEGKKSIRGLHGSKDKLWGLMTGNGYQALFKLVGLVAYYEAFCDSSAHTKCTLHHDEPPEDVWGDARNILRTALSVEKHPDGARAVAVLAPLTRHRILRQELLIEGGVLDLLVGLLDKTIKNVKQPGRNFGQAITGLTYLLQSEDTRKIVIDKLAASYSGSTKSRLSRIMDVDDSHILTPAVLRMTLTLVCFPEAETLCTEVKPRLRELATKDVGPVGSLATEILLVLYHHNEEHQLDVDNANVRTNLANVLVRLNPHIRFAHGSSANVQIPLASPLLRVKHDGRDSSDESNHVQDPKQKILRQLFGLDASMLDKQQKGFISRLKSAVQNGTTQERTASTMTVLKLVESKVIRTYLREMKLLDIFIEQLRREDSALLAAYALATCLGYEDMMNTIRDNEQLPKNIFDMLREDYFDDAVGRVEGFEIFKNLMEYEELRKKVEKQPIVDILEKKLGGGKHKEIKTGLICLDILQSANKEGGWCDKLVENSWIHLRKSKWGEQKTGITLLSALSLTQHGVEAIDRRIISIVEMLLPQDYTLSEAQMQLTEPSIESSDLQSPTSSDGAPKVDTVPLQSNLSIEQVLSGSSAPAPPNEPHVTKSAGLWRPTSNVADKALVVLKKIPSFRILGKSTASTNEFRDMWPRPLLWMMGPAYALRILAKNKQLQTKLRQSQQYHILKSLHFFGELLDTPSSRINTPNQLHIIRMFDKLIKIVDEDSDEEGFMSIEDVVLVSNTQHWDR